MSAHFNAILSRKSEEQMKWSGEFVQSLYPISNLGYLDTQVNNAGVRVRQLTESEHTVAPSAHELDVLDEATGRFEQRVAHLLDSKETLERRQAELVEFRHVLRETASFFHVYILGDLIDVGWRSCGKCSEQSGDKQGRCI